MKITIETVPRGWKVTAEEAGLAYVFWRQR